ncbi:hypothetical protein EB093_08650 [bacterium]|nr:hypothetical protein [bacterium]
MFHEYLLLGTIMNHQSIISRNLFLVYKMSSSSAYDTQDKIVSLDWNGQYFILTARSEITDASFVYAYSSDGRNWAKKQLASNVSSQNPYIVKWLGDKFLVGGNLAASYTKADGSTETRSCLVNIVDGEYAVAQNTDLSNTAILYDVERNIEFPHGIVFPRTTSLAIGNTIAFSFDQGNLWTVSSNAASLFSGGVADAVWNGLVWVAGGSGSRHTLATSLDGNVWVGRGSYVFASSCNGVDWSPAQNRFMAVGSGGGNIVATSMDGIYWTATNGLRPAFHPLAAAAAAVNRWPIVMTESLGITQHKTICSVSVVSVYIGTAQFGPRLVPTLQTISPLASMGWYGRCRIPPEPAH